jgi:hypothetical protein
VNGTLISGPTRIGPGDELSLGSELLRVKQRNPSALTVKMDDGTKADDKLRNK